MKGAIIKYAKEHFIGFLFSVFFGSLATVALFYFTSMPGSSTEVKKKFESILLNEFKSITGVESNSIEFNSLVSQSLDFSEDNSVFVYATTTKEENIYRILGVFEQREQSLLDKLVGRPGFYRLASFSLIPVPYSDNLLPEDIEVEDYDLDGNKEILVHVKSIFADSISTGVILLKKNEDEIWRFLSLPSLSNKLSELLNDKLPHPEGLNPVSNPTIWFGKRGSSDIKPEELIKDYTNYSVYEDKWEAIHNGKSKVFVSLRNGGKIKKMKHPYGGHLQFGVAANIIDSNAVLDVHHIFITFLKIEEENLVTDIKWNWGFPMLSISPEEISEIFLEEFHETGISSHIIEGTFFGYTEFERIQNQ